MKIVLDKKRKVGQVYTNEGAQIKCIGEYSYKNMLKEDKYGSEEELQADLDEFNEYLKDKDDIQTIDEFQGHITNYFTIR
jgi:hypothetical protein